MLFLIKKKQPAAHSILEKGIAQEFKTLHTE
jgi:hypothetical protein